MMLFRAEASRAPPSPTHTHTRQACMNTLDTQYNGPPLSHTSYTSLAHSHTRTHHLMNWIAAWCVRLGVTVLAASTSCACVNMCARVCDCVYTSVRLLVCVCLCTCTRACLHRVECRHSHVHMRCCCCCPPTLPHYLSPSAPVTGIV